MTVLFLGVGNLHRADDGVGPLLAQRLAADPALARRGVRILAHSGEGASLMQIWEGASRVVIVDAMKSGRRRGVICRFDAAKEPLRSGVFRYSSHLFSLAEAVELARRLGRLPPSMLIYGIEGGVFTFGAPLSPSVVRALGRVEGFVREELTEKGSERGLKFCPKTPR